RVTQLRESPSFDHDLRLLVRVQNLAENRPAGRRRYTPRFDQPDEATEPGRIQVQLPEIPTARLPGELVYDPRCNGGRRNLGHEGGFEEVGNDILASDDLCLDVGHSQLGDEALAPPFQLRSAQGFAWRTRGLPCL